AMACAREGARVVVVGRDAGRAAAAEEALGSGHRALTGDATDPATAERAIACAIDELGGFDGLYHVAGGSGRRFGDGPLHELTDEGLRATFDLNFNSLVYSNRAAVRALLDEKKPGSILNMGSVLAGSPSPRYFATSAYAATKAAIEGFTRSSAAYYASSGIRFNVVAPALTETKMASRATSDDAIEKFVCSKQPLDGGRVGRPDDVDAAAVYFLSPASGFVTGQVLKVDGGWALSEGQYGPMDSPGIGDGPVGR
ncbi:MAG: SDR family oxidoreductase, partial [Planctomycetota bacterium]